MPPPGPRTGRCGWRRRSNQLPQIFLPDPNVVALAVQQARIAELEARIMPDLLASLDRRAVRAGDAGLVRLARLLPGEVAGRRTSPVGLARRVGCIRR